MDVLFKIFMWIFTSVCAVAFLVLVAVLVTYIAVRMREEADHRRRINRGREESPALRAARRQLRQRTARLHREKLARDAFASEKTLDIDQIQELFSNELD